MCSTFNSCSLPGPSGQIPSVCAPLPPLSYCPLDRGIHRFWAVFKVATSSSWRHDARWLSTPMPAALAASSGLVLTAQTLSVFQNASGAPLQRLLVRHTAATHSFCDLLLRMRVSEGRGPRPHSFPGSQPLHSLLAVLFGRQLGV